MVELALVAALVWSLWWNVERHCRLNVVKNRADRAETMSRWAIQRADMWAAVARDQRAVLDLVSDEAKTSLALLDDAK